MNAILLIIGFALFLAGVLIDFEPKPLVADAQAPRGSFYDEYGGDTSHLHLRPNWARGPSDAPEMWVDYLALGETFVPQAPITKLTIGKYKRYSRQ